MTPMGALDTWGYLALYFNVLTLHKNSMCVLISLPILQNLFLFLFVCLGNIILRSASSVYVIFV